MSKDMVPRQSPMSRPSLPRQPYGRAASPSFSPVDAVSVLEQRLMQFPDSNDGCSVFPRTKRRRRCGGPETTTRRVKLKSSDGVLFIVDEAVANESLLVQDMIQAQGNDRPLDLNVESKTLRGVIEYCRYLVESRNTSEGEEGLTTSAKWHSLFAEDLDDEKETLINWVLAVGELRIEGLKDLLCQKMKKLMAELWPEETLDIE